VLSIQTSYKPEDIDRMHELERLCFTRAFRWTKKDFVAALEDCDVVSGVYGLRIVGYVLGEVENDTGHIVSLVVDPEFQGKGFGRTLMEEAESFYRKKGMKRLQLEVHTDNPAQVLYFKLGYRVTELKPRYYSNGSTAIVMAKAVRTRA
jgi:ribosomal-protein-alanine N-acetyltransferase